MDFEPRSGKVARLPGGQKRDFLKRPLYFRFFLCAPQPTPLFALKTGFRGRLDPKKCRKIRKVPFFSEKVPFFCPLFFPFFSRFPPRRSFFWTSRTPPPKCDFYDFLGPVLRGVWNNLKKVQIFKKTGFFEICPRSFFFIFFVRAHFFLPCRQKFCHADSSATCSRHVRQLFAKSANMSPTLPTCRDMCANFGQPPTW